MLGGNIEAVPLKEGKKLPCTYCAFIDVCGNHDGAVSRQPSEEALAEAAEILGKSKKGGKQ